jgi:glycogen debranching enzyme
MSSPWVLAGPASTVDSDTITLMDGTSFCISSRTGELPAGAASGLFIRDTRVLSGWSLSVDGESLRPLVCEAGASFSARFVSEVGDDRDTRLLVVCNRLVGEGMREELEIHNPGSRARTIPVVLGLQADFADLFDVKEGRRGEPAAGRAMVPAGRFVTFSGPGDLLVRITSDVPADLPWSQGFRWSVSLAPHSVWRTNLETVVQVAGTLLTPTHRSDDAVGSSEVVRRRERHQGDTPQLDTSDPDLASLLTQSISDLATLRIFDPDLPSRPVIAAGAPWFMALFGRDSLITASMLLPLDSQLALGTLHALAARQGRTTRAESDEEPGRILHELRFGPAGTSGLDGSAAYYGTADATPLFVIVLGELVRWVGPGVLDTSLVDAADRALQWVDEYGDRDGDGFVEYGRSTPRGLLHQGWKDSHDGISFQDGTLAEPPIALSEVQGYVYAAMRARARIARALDDHRVADHWSARAARLRESFDRHFWLADAGYYAVGLDGDKRQIDSLTSNNGHLLWTGIVRKARAAQVAGHLASPAMATGWGVRTLATTAARYDPLSYHNGSVWPHDTALCAAGLAKYGYTRQAADLATCLIDASRHFSHRLPELFGGYDRAAVPLPVPYPAACAPQAWAAAAPVSLLTTMLGVRPRRHTLQVSPDLPARFQPLTLNGLVLRGERYGIAVTDRGRADTVRLRAGLSG